MNPNIDLLSPLILAYVGDSAMEVLVRERLALSGQTKPGVVNKLALNYVTALSQSMAVTKVEPHFTQKEADIFRRGKNAKFNSLPKSAGVYEYRRATGLEAVFGYNYLCGNFERNKELFNIAYEV